MGNYLINWVVIFLWQSTAWTWTQSEHSHENKRAHISRVCVFTKPVSAAQCANETETIKLKSQVSLGSPRSDLCTGFSPVAGRSWQATNSQGLKAHTKALPVSSAEQAGYLHAAVNSPAALSSRGAQYHIPRPALLLTGSWLCGGLASPVLEGGAPRESIRTCVRPHWGRKGMRQPWQKQKRKERSLQTRLMLSLKVDSDLSDTATSNFFSDIISSGKGSKWKK